MGLGGFTVEARGISADGNVAVGRGLTISGDQAYRWTTANGLNVLTDLPGGRPGAIARDASADGSVIVGSGNYTCCAEGRAVLWTQPSVATDLGTLLTNGVSHALAVSDDGSVVVGSSNSPNTGLSFDQEAFRWTSSEGMVGLGDFAGGSFSSSANGVSGDGSTIVGFGTTSAGNRQAFRWTSSSGMVGIGYLAGGFNARSEATNASTDGSVIVGSSWNSQLNDEAFRWTASTGMIGLGDLPGGGFFSQAYGVSGDGSIVVGRSRIDGNNDRAFFFGTPFTA